MPDYSNGKVYKVVNDVNDTIYVGSTTQQLCFRMGGHRQAVTKPHSKGGKMRNSPLYVAMRTIGVSHFKIVLLCAVVCKNKEALCAAEYEIMNDLKLHNTSMYNVLLSDSASAMEGKKHSVDSKNQMSRRHIRRGSVFMCTHNGKDEWRFVYRHRNNDTGESAKLTKSFSTSKYGEGAQQKAIDAQNAMYPIVSSDDSDDD